MKLAKWQPRNASWAKSSDDFHSKPACEVWNLHATVVCDELQSNVQLELMPAASHRELKWILSSRESGQPHFGGAILQSQTGAAGAGIG